MDNENWSKQNTPGVVAPLYGDQPLAGNTPPTHTIKQAVTDKMLADEFRARLGPVFDALCDILNEANVKGLQIGFGVQRDNFGRNTIAAPTIFRPL